MPTARGWLSGIVGLALWGAGRVLGSGNLEQVGFALPLLVVIAAVIVSTRRHELRVKRAVVPERSPAGRPVRVTLEIENRGRRSAPLVLLDDHLPVELSAGARFAISGIEPGGDRGAAYEVRPPRRGRYDIGPLTITFVDPFGLARARVQTTGTNALLVRPRIEHLSLPRDLGAQRSMAVSALRQLSGSRGEDFYTLREYATGDDLRKIHWPSTAKRAKPMIRQEETPWHTRATILLDDRDLGEDPFGGSESFERVVEAAASFADLYHRSGYTYRLTGAHHRGYAPGRGLDHYNRCLDLLATLEFAPVRTEDALLTRLAELETGIAAEGTLVVASSHLGADGAAAITKCRRRFREVFVVLFPVHRFGSLSTKARWEGERRVTETVRLLARSGTRTVVGGPGESLAAAWSSLASGSARGGEHWDPRLEPA